VLSIDLQQSLEREVIGQPRAVHTLVRAATIGRSGLGGREAPVGMFLFLGPSGTGKTHSVRSLARVLNGDTDALVVVDCIQFQSQEDWQELLCRIAPRFRYPVAGYGNQVRSMAPQSVLLFEHLEALRPEFVQALLSAFESGRVALPDGAYGSLRGCQVVMTSRICGREIFGDDRPEIGFSHTGAEMEESEKARIYDLCSDAVERYWGNDFLGHLDDLVIFHRLREAHLPQILARFVVDLNRQLAARGVQIDLDAEAREFLLSRGARFLQHGAWYLGKVFRRFVLFPTADLASSDRLGSGSRIHVQGAGDRLNFTVSDDGPTEGIESDAPARIHVPIRWDEPAATSAG